MNNSVISLVKCPDYDPARVHDAVRQSVDLLGGMSAFVKPRSRVLVKPNLLMAKPPEAAITTHPEVVRGVIRLLKENDCRIVAGDGPSVWGKCVENVDAVYEATGIRRVCEEEGVALVKFEKRRMRGKFPMAAILDEVDCFVNVPKLKTHELTLLTGAVKNIFGLISGTYKTELHKQHYDKAQFARVLVDIYQEIKPALTVVDGITALEGDGPASGGAPRALGLVSAGADCVALDAVMALIMGVEPADVMTIREAYERGLGQARREHITVMGEKLDAVIGAPFALPSTSFRKKMPQPAIKIAVRLIRYYPYVKHENCIKCGACIDACPQKIISFDNRNRISFAYKRCIACFCCQEACPASAVKVGKSWFARMIGL